MLEIAAACDANLLGVENHGMHPGARADLVLVVAETLAHAVLVCPMHKLIISNGNIVARDGVFLES